LTQRIDAEQPKVYNHLTDQSKRKVAAAIENARVKKDNHTMLTHMRGIMVQRQSFWDDRPYEKTTMNGDVRRIEQHRIAAANKKLVSRLTNNRAHYR
jgi:hypothetical protein